MFIKKFFSWFKKDNKLDTQYSVKLNEWIEETAEELEVDAVGLWQIMPNLREEFGLQGETLIKYTRKALLAILARGAKPVVGKAGKKGWWLKDVYGNTPEEQAEAIIQEWLQSGKDPDPSDSLWFTMPCDINDQPE